MSESDIKTPAARWSAKHREKLKQLNLEKYQEDNKKRAARRRAQLAQLRENDPEEWQRRLARANEQRRKHRETRPDLIQAQRERYNARRRKKTLSPEIIALREQRKAERAARSAETAEQRKARRAEGDRRRAKARYAALKALIGADPQAREEYYAKCREYAAKKRETARAAITPEEKARKLQRAAETRVANMRKAAAKRRAEQQANPKSPNRAPKKAKPPVDKTKVGNGRKKPGRLLALMGWRGF
jgi:hypothetical protein